jgi:hypothetical protein
MAERAVIYESHITETKGCDVDIEQWARLKVDTWVSLIYARVALGMPLPVSLPPYLGRVSR